MENDLIVLPREDLLQFLGKMALPPWIDEKGRMIGVRIDCAPIAQEISEWIDANEVTGVLL